MAINTDNTWGTGWVWEFFWSYKRLNFHVRKLKQKTFLFCWRLIKQILNSRFWFKSFFKYHYFNPEKVCYDQFDKLDARSACWTLGFEEKGSANRNGNSLWSIHKPFRYAVEALDCSNNQDHPNLWGCSWTNNGQCPIGLSNGIPVTLYCDSD